MVDRGRKAQRMMYTFFAFLFSLIVAATTSAVGTVPDEVLRAPAGTSVDRGANQMSLDGGATWFPIAAVAYETPGPDQATGQATGKRMHKSLVVVRPIDQASPKLYKALVSGSVFPKVILKFPGKAIVLGNVAVASTNRVAGASTSTMHEMERDEFTFEQIQYTDDQGKSLARDSWISK